MRSDEIMEAEGYTLLFEAGEGEGYWTVEEDPDGLLCVTTNAESRRVVDADRHRGWDAEQLRSDLLAAGMAPLLVHHYMKQAGL